MTKSTHHISYFKFKKYSGEKEYMKAMLHSRSGLDVEAADTETVNC